MSSSQNQNQLVLVSGISGYVGNEIGLQLLEAGFRVRGAIRATSSYAQDFLKAYPEYKDRIEFVTVGDLDQPGVFDQAVKDVGVIAHTASPIEMAPADNAKELLIPALEGRLSILRSAANEPSVKFVVLTTSIVAFFDLLHPPSPDTILTAQDWNPTTFDQAKYYPREASVAVYAASKGIAEKAAWDFVETNKPGFKFATVAPHWVTDVEQTPPTVLTSSYVDVADVARAHVGAILNQSVSAGKRYLLVGGPQSNEYNTHSLYKLFPDQRHRLPATAAVPITEFPAAFGYDSSPAAKDFGFKYITLEESLKAQFEQLFSLKA